MLPRGLSRKVKKRSSMSRFLLVLLALVIILSSAEFGAIGVNAEYVIPIKDIPKLQKVGPIHEDFGYPVWYKDSKGLRLEICADLEDPNCALDPAEIPDPNQPITMKPVVGEGENKKPNFPEELFYQLASSEIDLPNGGRAVATFALEAAWANEIPQEGDQIVFGRVRFRIDGLKTGEEYTIYHPYGVDKYTAVEEDEDEPDIGEIRFVEDIGVNGGFEGPKTSRIGTFLEWDKGAPEGYVGDPNVEHTIKNGYKNKDGVEQNYFRIVGDEDSKLTDGLSENSLNYCGKNCIQTDLFSLMGKKATTSGVDIARATYSRNVDDEGKPINGGTIDVFAWTEERQGIETNIEVSANGIQPVKLKGKNGQYFARISFTGDTPPELTVTNKSDNPLSVKRITPIDKVTAKAYYNINDKILTIEASSSDQVSTPKLTVSGFEDISDEGGVFKIVEPGFVPPNITVTSSIKDVILGSVTVPVEITNGDGFSPVPVLANARAVDPDVVIGDEVILDGSGSTGPIQSYRWTQNSEEPNQVIFLDNSNSTAFAKFTAPKVDSLTELKFNLTVIGVNGSSNTSTVTVNVSPPIGVTKANAGPDQLGVEQGRVVTLDGSGSTGESLQYSWKLKTGGPVTINGSDTAKPTFIAPKKYSATKPSEGTWLFELTVTGPGGTAKDEVMVTTKGNNVSLTNAELRGSEWRVSGQSEVPGPGVTVDVILFTNTDTGIKEIKLGTATVDPAVEGTPGAAWSFRGIGPIVTNGTITLRPSNGPEKAGNIIRRFR
jgi:hypothetical protein